MIAALRRSSSTLLTVKNGGTALTEGEDYLAGRDSDGNVVLTMIAGGKGESAEALAFARQRVLEELEEKRRSQREQERGSAALCFSGAALVVILLL